MMKQLALIILNYNSSEDTIKCINKLLEFKSEFNIIIVDNLSTDNSYPLLYNKYFNTNNVDVIQSDKNGGYSYGNNFGIKFAKAKYNSNVIGIVNPDVIIPEFSILENMMSVLEENDEIAVVGGCPIENGKFSPNKAAWKIPSKKEVILDRLLLLPRNKNNELFIFKDKLALVECIVGCFFLIKESIFNEIGYFDESVFLYNEENILGIKLKQKGYKLSVLIDQFYYHNHNFSKDKSKSLKDKMNMLRIRFHSRKYFIRRYYPKLLIPLLFTIEIINVFQILFGHIKWKIIGINSEKYR